MHGSFFHPFQVKEFKGQCGIYGRRPYSLWQTSPEHCKLSAKSSCVEVTQLPLHGQLSYQVRIYCMQRSETCKQAVMRARMCTSIYISTHKCNVAANINTFRYLPLCVGGHEPSLWHTPPQHCKLSAERSCSEVIQLRLLIACKEEINARK